MNIRNKQFPNSLDMCSQRPGVYIQTPTHQKLLQTQPSLCVSTVYTGCLLLILSSVVWVLISAAACRRVSLIVTLLLQISDSPPSFCFCVFQSRCCQSLFLVWLYLHASPCDLECVSHKGGGGGMENNCPEGARWFFASVNNLFSVCLLAAQLSSLSIGAR